MKTEAELRLRRSLASWNEKQHLQWQPLRGGANNRVFRLLEDEQCVFCAKVYFQEADGSSPRFATERSFYRVCADVARGSVPHARWWDEREQVGIFDWVEGSGVVSLTAGDVAAAGRFIQSLQTAASANALGPASDGCWSEVAHLESVDRRINVLAAQATQGKLPQSVAGFVQQELEPAWRAIREAFGPPQRHQVKQLVVSPSDFGFHNALRRPDGSWCFLDFEYAGLDDPAKLLCDFMARPGTEWPARAAEVFARAAGFSGHVLDRGRRLLPVHRVKWACIALNDFLPPAILRRKFSGQNDPGKNAKQLLVARELLEAIAKVN
jgi:hypothetical protein